METSLFCILCILSVFCITNSFSFTHQNNLLLQLRTQFVFNSSLSTKLGEWNESYKEECCSWGGVECDAQGHVISLQLDNEAISGEIDDSSILFSFRYLEKLNLAENDFGGSKIPSAIHNLTHLMHLNLSTSNFTGQVPLGLSSLTSLVSLDLSFDDMFRPLTIENPNLKTLLQNLTSLKELYLDWVNISTTGGDWGFTISTYLPKLQKLSLRGCGLSGPLHSSLAELRSLSIFRLDDNILSTTIPTFFANFSRLVTLTLTNCSLKGSFPMMIFQIPTLEYLDLSFNLNLSGTLPQFSHAASFRSIMLSSTNFTGSLPNSINNLQMLSRIYLSNCKFTGTIPLVLLNLTELTELDLSQNSFSGSIPSFPMLKKLTYLNLGYNKFTGCLGSHNFEGNPSLKYLLLDNNLLSGSIPRSLFDFPSSNISRLDLSHNKLEEPIPESFFELENLVVLLLSHNLFNGTVNFGKFQSRLTDLDISYNNLSVNTNNINSSMLVFSQLNTLILASCNLCNFPNFKNQTHLLSLDLSNNHIAGEIPSWIWEIGSGNLEYLNLSFNLLLNLQKPYHMPNSIRSLDLHSNQLHGPLPSIPSTAHIIDFSHNSLSGPLPSIPSTAYIIDFSHNSLSGPLPSIPSTARYIDFSNNSLSGAIPASICNPTSLVLLNLAKNNLSGKIPPCLFKDLELLSVLNLGENNISGNIPDTLSNDCNLQTLDLRKNNLGGKVPPSLRNCKSLEVINVGSNRIEDSFPCMISSSLRVLILRFNEFQGEVKCHESWPNLQIIDIASNNFSGYLDPMKFLSWKGMLHDSQLNSDILSHSGYEDNVILTIKGLELEFVKILKVVTSIDFSWNNFEGEIPSAIGDLAGLYFLNLSHNALTGTIPKSFGNLTHLESLDLSNNRLTGKIPRELAGLTFLAVLNLSYNKLVGAIPKGRQFQTFSASSFQGNAGLCDFPLDRNCSGSDKNGGSSSTEQPHEKQEMKWDYIAGALGYGVGLGSTVWFLFGCESIRQRFSEKADGILVYIFMNWKGRKRGPRNQVRRQ